MSEYNTEETRLLDEQVNAFGLPTQIAINKSEFWGSDMASDIFYDGKETFVFRRLVVDHCGKSYGEVRNWGLEQVRQFYVDNLLDTEGRIKEKFELDLSFKSFKQELSSASEVAREVLKFRWDNGFSFMDYQSRVDLAIERKLKEQGKEVSEIFKKMKRALAAREKLRGILTSGSHLKPLDERTLTVLEGIAANLRISDFIED